MSRGINIKFPSSSPYILQASAGRIWTQGSPPNLLSSIPVSTTFDFFISPTGDDNNVGTLASPWSITALNSKHALYAGKKVGILPGTYTQGTVGGINTTLFSIYQGLVTSSCALQIQGGTSGTPTLIGASTSTGVYSPPVLGSGPTAKLDYSLSSGTTVPTTNAHALGQSTLGSNAPTQIGNVTIAGLGIKYFTASGIGFQIASTIPNVLLQDCEVSFGNNVPSSNNPGALFFYKFPTNLRITNCKVHDLTTITGGANAPWGMAAVMVNQDAGTNEGFGAGQIDHCTFYRVGQGVTTKNNYSNLNVSYSYIEFANLAVFSGSAFQSAIFGSTQAPGTTVTYKYNVIIGGIIVHPEDGTANQGAVIATNNTFYTGPGGSSSTASQEVYSFSNNGASGSGQFNHNIVWLDSGYNTAIDPFGTVGFNATGAGFTFDRNYYGTGCTFGSPGHSDVSLTTWKTLGFDPNSSTMATTPFVSAPATATVGSFVVKSPFLSASDGLPAGALNSSGAAADGSGPVGCNF